MSREEKLMIEAGQGNFDFNNVSWKSPDGNFRLIYTDLYHNEDSSLLAGKCYLESVGIKSYLGETFSGPPVWSDDSMYIAIPRWITSFQPGYLQKLYIMNVLTRKIWQSMEEFRVLNLISFNGQVIYGTDSPNYRPKQIEISIGDKLFESFKVIKWEDY
jgi:hypothetical protein